MFFMPEIIKKYYFFLILAILLASFFSRNRLKDVKDIDPRIFLPPHQEEAFDKTPIKLLRDGYSYLIEPLYLYEVGGIVVSKMNYRFFSIYKYNSVFPLDLCLLWGENARKRVFAAPTIRFTQDCRWCWAQWKGKLDFDMHETSNNHLIFAEPGIEARAASLLKGDQVFIKGKLVNVTAALVGKKGEFDPQGFTWKSSVKRNDTGAGACEVIYVEELEILRRAHPLANFLFYLSLYALLLVILWKIFRFFTAKAVL